MLGRSLPVDGMAACVHPVAICACICCTYLFSSVCHPFRIILRYNNHFTVNVDATIIIIIIIIFFIIIIIIIIIFMTINVIMIVVNLGALGVSPAVTMIYAHEYVPAKA